MLKFGANTKCLIACKTRDRIDDELAFSPIRRLRVRLATRIGNTFSAKAGAYLLCITVDCSPDELIKSTNQSLQAAANTFDDDLLREVGDTVSKNRLSEIITRKIFEKM